MVAQLEDISVTENEIYTLFCVPYLFCDGFEVGKGKAPKDVSTGGTKVGAKRVSYLHHDILGTPVAATDDTGQVLWRNFRLAYGGHEEGKDAGTKPDYRHYPIGYTGNYEDDSTGLTYAQARYYHKDYAMFMALDPLHFRESDLTSVNRYVYAGNNPYKYVDPTGTDVLGINPEQPGDWIRDANGNIADPYNDMLQNEGTDPVSSMIDRAVDASGPRAAQALSVIIDIGTFYKGLSGSSFVLGARNAGSIRNVNPLKGTENCVNCAIATDATLAGRPASALSGNRTNISVLEKAFGSKFGPAISKSRIESSLLSAGHGARGVVFGNRGAGVMGHVFNVVNQKGVVRFLDGQTGKTAVFSGEGYINFRLLRTN